MTGRLVNTLWMWLHWMGRALTTRGVDVVTFEFENIPYETLQRVAEISPVFPAPLVLDTTRHRLREKTFLSTHGFPVAPYRPVSSVEELRDAVIALKTPCILKTATFGYDGKGQTKITHIDQCDAAWGALGQPLGVVEGFIDFEYAGWDDPSKLICDFFCQPAVKATCGRPHGHF